MMAGTVTPGKTLRTAACAAAVGLVLLLPAPGRGDDDRRGRSGSGPVSRPSPPPSVSDRGGRGSPTFDNTFDDRGRWGDLEDFNWTILQMQREGISSQEERAREAGRAIRRDQIEQSQEKAASEHEAYFDAILEASQAALRAPQGVYYRKPGFLSTEPPEAEARRVDAGGSSYLYDRGVFWVAQGQQYIVVTAPVGAVVPELPAAAIRVVGGTEPLWYFFGAFFRQRAGGIDVVAPPPGVAVTYLPDGYTQESRNGSAIYRFGGIAYRPVFVQGVLVYQVVEG